MKMKHKILFIAAMAVFSPLLPVDAQRLTDAVDPFIGSGGHGHVFVGASLPFGGVTVGPTQVEDGWDWCSGYHWSGKYIRGFAPIHLSGTGCPDLADILLMPVTGAVDMTVGDTTKRASGFYSTYSHRHETCRPGYYEVLLDRYGIKARMTATKRVAYEEYHYPAGSDARIVVDVENGIGWNVPVSCELRQLDDTTLVGHRFSRGWASDRRHYFVIRFSRPMKSWITASSQAKSENGSPAFPVGYGAASFDVTTDTVVGVRMALSSVSLAGAMANLDNESAGRSFEQVKTSADSVWNAALSRVEATFDCERERRIFYTALYHTMIHPTLYGDSDRSYRGSDGNKHRSDGFDNYTTFSLWDTYRALHPLFTLVYPELQHDWAQSLLVAEREQGFLPIWPLTSSETGCMVGSPAVPFLADLCLKGLVADVPAAYEAMKRSMSHGFRGLPYLNEMGYVPCDKVKESVSVSLENYIAFAGVARVAKLLGRDAESAHYDSLSRSYVKLYDRKAGFFRGRLSTGEFRSGDFHPGHHTEDFTEGTAWQYLWLVPHDVDGLISLVGGAERFEQRLDSLFIVSSDLGESTQPDITGLIGQYAHGNEPSHHIIYMYNRIGKPWKTARWLHRVFDEMYADRPDGLSGNEDAGQMSAWYVLSALGFYPIDPIGGRFDIGSPIVRTATLHVGGGRTFKIIVHRDQPGDIYVAGLRLNGKSYGKTYIDYDTLTKGGVLEFDMASEPTGFGTKPDAWR